MLVLCRKEGERIQIDDAITLTVLSVHGGRVRLGFAAPSHVPIHREEVSRRIAAERESAATTTRSPLNRPSSKN
jgi:carbon storage regulator